MLTRDEMIQALSEGVCQVKFTKNNGDERDMTCTRVMDAIPEKDQPKGSGKEMPEASIPVYDTVAEGWRSFTIANVISFEVIK